MNSKTKYYLIKFLIYILIGFVAAFLWNESKK